MEVAVYIKIAEKAPFFEKNPYFSCLREQFQKMIFYDFDNHSERFVIEAILPMLEEASKIVVFIEFEGGELGVALSFFQNLINYNASTFIFFEGENQMLKRILTPFQNKTELQKDWQKKIFDFLKEP